MAKLTGAKKAAFLERMAKGRRKAKRANPKKTARKPKKKAASQAKKKAAKKKPAVRKRQGRMNPRGRRNGDTLDAAEGKFEEFHGKKPGQVIEYEQAYRYPENFAELGDLVELRFDLNTLNRDFPLTGFKGTQAVCTPDGANIYFIGGDQSIDFEALAIASDKDFVELGPCTYICYHTVKGFHDFVQTNYWHRFGEEDDIFPSLVYDRLNKSLFLTSGNYRVRPEGIVN